MGAQGLPVVTVELARISGVDRLDAERVQRVELAQRPQLTG